MKSRENRGITLIALAITIILLLILGGVVVSTFNNGNIIENSLSATEKAKVETMKENIQLAITSRIVKEDGDVTIEQIIDELEKKGLVDSGDSNSENGQVKTNQDGYVYEIKQDSYGNWQVNYVGTGKVEEVKIAITASTSPTGISNSVTITVNAKAKSGIKSLQMPNGEVKTYGSGNTEVTESYEVTTNGTYSFIATNNNGDSITKKVVVDNILEGTIQISANPRTPTMGDVVITVKWPTGKYSTIQEISINGGSSWSNYTGSQSQVTVSSNCTIKARVRNGSTEMKTVTLEVTNIDKNAPIVTTKQSSVTIKEGDSNDMSNYFTVSQNGTAEITSITYADTSNNNVEISNTNTLTVGTHTIKCIVTKETGVSASATVTIVVEMAKDIIPPKLKIMCQRDSMWVGTTISIVSVEDNVAMPEKPVYSYYIKLDTESDDKYKLVYSGTNTSCDVTVGYDYKNCMAKVEVADLAGNIAKAEVDVYGSECFVEGTKVLTEEGMKEIQNIQVGEKVWAINIDNNTKELKKVTRTIKNKTKEIYEINVGNEIIKATPRHQFYVIDKGWIRASKIEKGDLVCAKNKNLEIKSIELKRYEEAIDVYNLTVEDFHTYVITEYEVLVHNAQSVITTNTGTWYAESE